MENKPKINDSAFLSNSVKPIPKIAIVRPLKNNMNPHKTMTVHLHDDKLEVVLKHADIAPHAGN